VLLTVPEDCLKARSERESSERLQWSLLSTAWKLIFMTRGRPFKNTVFMAATISSVSATNKTKQRPTVGGPVCLEHASHTLTLAAGDTVPIGSEPGAAPVQPKEKTMTIVSLVDRAHPQTMREFKNVTCSAVAERRGFTHDVIYNH
jgi:hypothetical protein